MPDDEEILALYDWRPEGTCFRCGRTGVEATLIQTLTPPVGGEYKVRACRDCVLALEAEVKREADKRGLHYAPGQLGRRKQ